MTFTWPGLTLSTNPCAARAAGEAYVEHIIRETRTSHCRAYLAAQPGASDQSASVRCQHTRRQAPPQWSNPYYHCDMIPRVEPIDFARRLMFARPLFVSRVGNVEAHGVISIRTNAGVAPGNAGQALEQNAGVFVKPFPNTTLGLAKKMRRSKHQVHRHFAQEYSRAVLSSDLEMVVHDQCWMLLSLHCFLFNSS